ncbi:hypothetical protein ACFL6X_09315, partial [Candidatus Latescibacterota bacterium]
LAAYGGTHMLVLVAVVVDVGRQVRAEMALWVAQWRTKSQEEWVPALSAETELEVDLGRLLLESAAIPAATRCSRVICAAGTLGFWEVARPRWPSLTIHRRLGGGAAVLLVPVSQLERARELLPEQDG